MNLLAPLTSMTDESLLVSLLSMNESLGESRVSVAAGFARLGKFHWKLSRPVLNVFALLFISFIVVFVVGVLLLSSFGGDGCCFDLDFFCHF